MADGGTPFGEAPEACVESGREVVGGDGNAECKDNEERCDEAGAAGPPEAEQVGEPCRGEEHAPDTEEGEDENSGGEVVGVEPLLEDGGDWAAPVADEKEEEGEGGESEEQTEEGACNLAFEV